jgi:hypothetical protein
MSGCSSQSVARLFAVALVGVLVACSGGSDGGGGKASPKTAPSTTAPPATIDLSKPIPGGSLHGTPRPPLENTGTDFAAIFKSLDANFRWLTENPDPAVISELYVPGTNNHDYWVPAFQELVSKGWRSADDGYQLLSADVADAKADVVSLRVVDAMDSEHVVDASGSQVGTGRPRDPRVKTWTVLLKRDGQGRWRFADWSRADAEVAA